MIAISNIVGISDLGLRGAGHLMLRQGGDAADRSKLAEFATIWAAVRLFVIMVTALTIASLYAFEGAARKPLAIWQGVMILAAAFDAIYVVRGGWLDTLGQCTKVERLFFFIVLSRVFLCFAALALFGAAPLAISLINLATGAAGLAAQLRWIGSPRALDLTAGGFADIDRRIFGMLKFSVAEPVSSWSRLSLPVIVLSTFAPPKFLATFVAFRAVFSASRQVASQVARYASVSYVNYLGADMRYAVTLINRSILICASCSLGVAIFMITDGGVLICHLLKDVDSQFLAPIAFSFAFAAGAHASLITASTRTRAGEFSAVAMRYYCYIGISFAFAAVAVVAKREDLYLLFVAIQEMALAIFFLGSEAETMRTSAMCVGLFAGALGANAAIQRIFYPAPLASSELVQIFRALVLASIFTALFVSIILASN